MHFDADLRSARSECLLSAQTDREADVTLGPKLPSRACEMNGRFKTPFGF